MYPPLFARYAIIDQRLLEVELLAGRVFCAGGHRGGMREHPQAVAGGSIFGDFDLRYTDV